MESILNNTQPIHVIPSYASVEEHALYTIASVEESYNNLCEAVGIEELKNLLEAEGKKIDIKAAIKKILDKFVAYVKELWQKIQDLAKVARDKMIVFVTDKVKKFTDAKVKKEDLIKAVEDSKPEVWKNFNKGIALNTDKAKKMADGVKTVTGQLCSTIESYKDNAEKVSEFDATVYYFDKLDKIIPIDKDMASSEIQKKIKDAIIVETTKADPKAFVLDAIKKDAGDLLSKNNLVKEFTSDIAAPYNDSKKAFDEYIKTAKKVMTDKAFSPLFKGAAYVARVNAAVIGAIESAYFVRFSYEYRILLRALGLLAVKTVADKAEKEEAKQESAQVEGEVVTTESAPEVTDEPKVEAPEAPVTESSTFQTELASLFNF